MSAAVLVGACLALPLHAATVDDLASAQAAVWRSPDDLAARLRLARLLSWTPGHLAEAAAQYRRILESAPNDLAASIELARVLSWSGQSLEAGRCYDAVLKTHPFNADALLGRAQVARWTGDLRRARRLLARGLALYPRDARFLAESAQLNLALGRRAAAREAAHRALALAPDAPEAAEAMRAVREASAPSVQEKIVYSEESTPVGGARHLFHRLSDILRGAAYPLPDTRLQILGSLERYEESGQRLFERSAGLDLRQGLPEGFYLDAGGERHQFQGGASLDAWNAEAGGTPFWGPIHALIGVRRRALADSPSGYEDIGFLERYGSGGVSESLISQAFSVREQYAGVSAAPWTPLYVYADAAVGKLDDGNSRASADAGAGLDIAGWLGLQDFGSMTLKLDYYHLEFQKTNAAYFSPASFTIYTPGLGLRFNPRSWATLGLEAGRPFGVQSSAAAYDGAAFARAGLTKALSLDARVQILDDTQFRIFSAVAGILWTF